MSRAFVSESDAQYQEADAPELKIPLAPGQKNYMTPEGAECLRSELVALAGSDRPRVALAVNRLLAADSGPDRDEWGEGSAEEQAATGDEAAQSRLSSRQ